jgi:PAS domain S-box-containing protein
VSFKARAYITSILALGGLALGRGVLLWDPDDLFRFFTYLALAVPASCLKVVLPGVPGTLSVLFVFLLAGVAELGLSETMLIGVVCVLVQSFWHARVRPRSIQMLFSVANIALAITAAEFVFNAPVLLALQAPFRLALVASVFFLTNTFPIAAVIALTEGKSIRQVWGHFYCWSFPYYLIGAAIVGVFSFADRMLDWQAWLLILPVVYVIYRSYHLYLDQLEGQKRQADEQRQHAAEVASLLAIAVDANAKLDAVIQASPLAIVGLDREGNVTNWNRMAESMFGWRTGEVLGRALPFSGERWEEIAETVVDGGLCGVSLSGVEMTQRRKDGTSFEAAVWTAPLRDSGADVSGILLTVADVSDRQRLEEQLRLSQKMEALGRLAGGIAHDFNNLLTVIKGYSSMLADELKADAYAADQAEEILNAGNRAGDLVAQLLTFSRRQVIQPEPLAINKLVNDVEKMLRRLIGEHIELRTSLDPEAGFILADQNQMAAVLMNLATNARDAMPHGGALSIETRLVQVMAGSKLAQAELPPGKYLCLAVRDTGCGMDAEMQQHVFEPFFTTKERGRGTGLGLPSVYGGVQQNRGRIFFNSEVGKGTDFSIYIPSLERAGWHEPQADPPKAVRGGSETILLVEDETALRRMLREALSKAGYRVLEASNGAEALEQWDSRTKEIHLLVTDVIMPVMNGLKLAKELRARSKNLRIMFMSGHAEDVITNQGVLDPNLELLPKPFLPDALVRKVREVLDREGAMRSAAGL